MAIALEIPEGQAAEVKLLDTEPNRIECGVVIAMQQSLLAHLHSCTHCDKQYWCEDEQCAGVALMACNSCIDGEWFEE